MVASGYEKTLPPSYFEDKYRADIDPWQFRSSPYERQKYEATLGALTKAQYRRALEVGCSIGIFTALLSPRCGQLVAIDSSKTALAEAKQQNLPNVQFERAVLPDDFPNGNFDLIVLSEVLYYFVEADLIRLAEKCGMSLDAGGRDHSLPLAGRNRLSADGVSCQRSFHGIALYTTANAGDFTRGHLPAGTHLICA